MNHMSLQEIQKSIGVWSWDNFGIQKSKVTGFPLHSLAPLLGIMEELGELCHATLKAHQGIRGFDDKLKYYRERDDAVADILVYLCDYASREEIDLLTILNDVWSKQVSKRNWRDNPQDG